MSQTLIKATFNIVVGIMLLTSTVSFAFAQSGDQGTGSNQQGTGQQDQFQQSQQGTGGTAGQKFNFAPGQGVLIVENLADSDIIFDVTEPNPTSAWVGPGQQQQFALPAGTYNYMGHHPLGDFAVAPNQFKITTGQVTRLACFKNICQLASSQQGQQQQSQQDQFQQGQATGVGQQQSQQGQQDQFQQGQQGTGGTTGQKFNFAPGQGMVIVENLADSDIIFDITEPNPTSAWVGPGQQQQFALPAGTYSFMGHHPLGDFAVAPGQVQVSPGQVTRLSCSTNLCQPVLSQQGQQGQQGQQQQSGQPQPTDNNGSSGGNSN